MVSIIITSKETNILIPKPVTMLYYMSKDVLLMQMMVLKELQCFKKGNNTIGTRQDLRTEAEVRGMRLACKEREGP